MFAHHVPVLAMITRMSPSGGNDERCRHPRGSVLGEVEAMLKRQVTRDLVAFYLLVAVLAALSFWLIRSYLDIIAFSLMTVIILKPVYDQLLRWAGGRSGLAVILTLVVFALAVVIPLWIAGRVIAGQLSALIASAQGSGGLQAAIGSISERFGQRLGTQLTPEQQQQLGTIAAGAATWIAGLAVNL